MPTAMRHWRLIRWDGLDLRVRSPWRSILFGLTIGAAFGIYMASSDVWLYAAVIPSSQLAIQRLPLAMQWAFFIPISALDEIQWRLGAMSGLVWLLVNLAGKPRPWCYWAALTCVALFAYPLAWLSYLTSLPAVPLTVLRELLLHGSAGMLWGWLYWRRGLLTAMAGHIGAHLTLQPLLTLQP